MYGFESFCTVSVKLIETPHLMFIELIGWLVKLRNDRASNRTITRVIYSNATTETNRNDVTHQVCLFI